MSGVTGAVIAGGATLAGAAISSNAASKAAKSQANAANRAADMSQEAAREANALNWAGYQQQLMNQQPYMQGGQTAYSALMGGMGLGAPISQANPQGTLQGYQPGTPVNVPPPAQGSAPTMHPAGSFAAGLSAATNNPTSWSQTATGALNPGAAPTGATDINTGIGANGAVTGGNRPGYSTYIDGVGDVDVKNYGATDAQMVAANNQYKNAFTDRFAPSDLTLDPSYQFRLQQGMRALENSGAARGMTGSGQNLADIVNYSQGAASQEYGNAFNRFQTEQGNLYNRLAALSGTGQVAAQNLGAAAGSTMGQMGQATMQGAGQSGNYITQGANATAAGSIAQGQAWGNAIGSLGNIAIGSGWLSGGK